MTDDRDLIIAEITSAFAAVEYPGDWCLRGSNEGDEPHALEKEFKGKTQRYALDAQFLDQAPKGHGTALTFFSDEAFRFYLSAYMIADLRGQLDRCDLVFHLTHGLDDSTGDTLINPRRYGPRTWFDEARHKFSMFSREEAAAIVRYLVVKRDDSDFDREKIDQALRNYWLKQKDRHRSGK